MTAMAATSKLKAWGVATRAFAYPASVVPVIVGSAFAWYVAGSFNWGYFALALIAGMLYHTGCNMINDYFDYKHGLDRRDTFGGSGVLTGGMLQPGELLIGAYLCLAAGSLIGVYFVTVFGLPVLLIGIAGLIGTVFYTTTPLAMKYAALGSPLVFIEMGPLMVLGGYLVQTGELSWNAVWVSIPVGLIVAGILQANDTRDIVHDREGGIRTIATMLGPKGARGYLSFLLFAPYAALFVLWGLEIAPWIILLPLVTFPLALQIHKLHREVPDELSDKLKDTPEMVAKLHMPFGLLMVIGIVAGQYFNL